MKTLIASTAVIAAALFASGAQAEYRLSNQLTRTMTIGKAPVLQFLPKFECRAQGTPVEFPDDIIIINKSSYAIAAGTQVKWQMVQLNSSGYKTLPQLAPGQHVFISHANPGGVPAGAACTVPKL
jgi:hypothetical protein